jgi:hypothetical protein
MEAPPYVLANKQLYLFAGFTIGFAVFLRMYIDERRSLYAIQGLRRPPLSLSRNGISRCSLGKVWATDLTRNGLDYDAKILYGRADEPGFVKVACTMAEYRVFRWDSPGKLEKVDCSAL